MTDSAGGQIVFTGQLNQISRSQAASAAEKLGFRCAGTVTADTVFIVKGEPPFNAKKIKEAEALGIEICSEGQFLGMLGRAFADHSPPPSREPELQPASPAQIRSIDAFYNSEIDFQPFFCPLRNPLPLKLGDGCEDMKHQPTGGRGGVDVLRQ